MRELIYALNFEVGLKTEMCCYGHRNGEDLIVIFDKCVTDNEIFDLANFLLKSKREVSANGMYLGANFGEFNKCVTCFNEEGDNEENILNVSWNFKFHSPYNVNDIALYENMKKSFMNKILKDLADYKKSK